jgi:hypothetical protein
MAWVLTAGVICSVVIAYSWCLHVFVLFLQVTSECSMRVHTSLHTVKLTACLVLL